MYHTTEIRWFGNEAEPLRNIYKTIEAPNNIQDKNRVDYYLLTGVDNLGIKMRQGIIEMKWLVESEIPLGTFPGLGEKWVKAGFTIQDHFDTQSYPNDTRYDWIEVKKFRQQKKFAVQDGIVPLKFDDNVKEGCFVEFTEITVNNKRYFSFSLEAFGTENKTSNNLKQTIEFLKSQLVPEILNNYTCCGYAAFLKRPA